MPKPFAVIRSLTLALLAVAPACVSELGEDEEVGFVAASIEAHPAVADAWVRSASSVRSNKGTGPQLYADRLDSGGGERRIFLRFTVPAGARPIAGARLELACTRGAPSGGDVRVVADTTWGERTITWLNQPAIGALVARRGAVASGTTVSFDLSSVVVREGTYSFAIVTTSDAEVRYASRETSTPPRLVIDRGEAPIAFDAAPALDAEVEPEEPAPDATPTPTPDATPTPPPPAPGDYLIIARADLLARPTSGPAWTALKAAADASPGTPDLCNQDNRTHPKVTLAAALVYARTGVTGYRDKAHAAILAAYPTQRVGCYNAILSLGRQLGAYVLAADLIGLTDPGFVSWLGTIRDKDIGGHGRWYVLRHTSGDSASNWGTFALASITAADRFLGDADAVARDWAIFRGYGDGSWPFRTTSSYQAAWNCGRYRAIEDLHCRTPDGLDQNGAPAEDASRDVYPTPHAGYVSEAMQGHVVQALLLVRAGYDAWGVNDAQVLRVGEFAQRFGIVNNSSASYYVNHVLNHVYGTARPEVPAGYGRVFGFTDWLFP